MAAALGLSFEFSEGTFWLWGPSLELSPDRKRWRAELSAFCERANMLIALSDPALKAIRHTGAVMLVDGDRRDYVVLAEAGQYECIFFPIVLSAKGGGPAPRPVPIRAID